MYNFAVLNQKLFITDQTLLQVNNALKDFNRFISLIELTECNAIHETPNLLTGKFMSKNRIAKSDAQQ